MTISDPQPLSHDPIRQWDVWDVDWEHEDGTSKVRPCLVLSSNQFNEQSDKIWISRFRSAKLDIPYRIEFNKDDASFAATGLSKTCHLYPAQARSVSRSRFTRRRGKLLSYNSMMLAILVQKAISKPLP